MPTIGSGIRTDSSIFNLKEIDVNKGRAKVEMLLIEGEDVVGAYKTIRDHVVFTNKRVIVVNVQGVTGKKTSFFSYPYSKVLFFAVETAGVFDIDSELILTFNGGEVLQFDFRATEDIEQICQAIAAYIL